MKLGFDSIRIPVRWNATIHKSVGQIVHEIGNVGDRLHHRHHRGRLMTNQRQNLLRWMGLTTYPYAD